jgi:hypothetical protein
MGGCCVADGVGANAFLLHFWNTSYCSAHMARDDIVDSEAR